MIFNPAPHGSSKIGRKIQFINPLRFSNKKHYWNSGVGNYGLITTEQIQMLNEMKQREKRAHLYDTKCIQLGLNHSIKDIKYPTYEKVKPQSFHDHNSFQLQTFSSNHQHVTKQQTPKKRSISELRPYNEENLLNQRIKTINYDESTPTGLTGMRRPEALRKLQSRRVKTLGVSEIQQQQMNPQNQNKINQMFDSMMDINQVKLQKKHLRIDSGNIRIEYSPQTLKSASKSIQKHSAALQPNPYTQRYQQGESILSKMKELKQNLLEDPDRIQKKTNKVDSKRFTKLKFQRDYSPTYCNSIDYPLKYFRHI